VALEWLVGSCAVIEALWLLWELWGKNVPAWTQVRGAIEDSNSAECGHLRGDPLLTRLRPSSAGSCQLPLPGE